MVLTVGLDGITLGENIIRQKKRTVDQAQSNLILRNQIEKEEEIAKDDEELQMKWEYKEEFDIPEPKEERISIGNDQPMLSNAVKCPEK